MVEQTNENECLSLPAIQDSASLTEYQRRVERAKRFGMDLSAVVGPQFEKPVYDKMDVSAVGQQRIDKLTDNISKIKHRQQKFAEEPMPEADTRIQQLEQRITKIQNVAKPEEIKSSAIIIEDLLYLYGVDFMSTDEINLYMFSFPDMKVCWINDSSCTLKFKSNEEAATAQHQFSVKPVQADESLGFDKRNFDDRIGWREALGYQHEVKGWQSLWIRFATDLDIKKPTTKGQDSRFYKFANHNKTHIKNSSFLRQAISKKEKYVRKTKDMSLDDELDNYKKLGQGEKQPLLGDTEMAESIGFDHETQLKNFDQELADQPEIELD